jgi:rSAM/selenodomain-associated transferase 2
MNQNISIIIPALNEADTLKTVLDSVAGSAVEEVIVVDGGSEDGTAERARSYGARVVEAPRGRATQMNAGAQIAQGDILLFLHADTCLPTAFGEEIRRVLEQTGVVAGAFSLGIGADGPLLRWIEHLANWRSRALQLPYGDQGFFLKAELFRSLNGFPMMPLMEDLEMARRVRKQGRIAISPLAVKTSARRWESRGVLRTTLLNQLFLLSYFLGISPQRIARWYYPAAKPQVLNPKS